jgi:hypothetical protein
MKVEPERVRRLRLRENYAVREVVAISIATQNIYSAA